MRFATPILGRMAAPRTASPGTPDAHHERGTQIWCSRANLSAKAFGGGAFGDLKTLRPTGGRSRNRLVWKRSGSANRSHT